MNAKNNHEKAIEIFHSYDQARDSYPKAFGEPTGILACSIEQIEDHLNLVDEVSAETGYTLFHDKFPVGTSKERMVEFANSKNKQFKRRAGVRALEAKYGHEVAASIVKKHSGRTIK